MCRQRSWRLHETWIARQVERPTSNIAARHQHHRKGDAHADVHGKGERLLVRAGGTHASLFALHCKRCADAGPWSWRRVQERVSKPALDRPPGGTRLWETEMCECGVLAWGELRS